MYPRENRTFNHLVYGVLTWFVDKIRNQEHPTHGTPLLCGTLVLPYFNYLASTGWTDPVSAGICHDDSIPINSF